MNQKLKYSEKYQFFVWTGTNPAESIPAMKAGFEFHEKGAWYTRSKYIALNLIDYAEGKALKLLLPLEDMIYNSRSTSSDANIPAPKGLGYKQFQKAGIWYGSQFDSVLIGDFMGLGKTVQALGIANNEGLRKHLIICPASLRYSWLKHYKEWGVDFCQVQVIKNGNQILNPSLSVIISYDLTAKYLSQLLEIQFDVITCDESHFLKNSAAGRTKTVLGIGNSPGLISRAKKRIFLSGTPIKNRANDFHHLLIRVKPEIIDHMTLSKYMKRWCVWQETPFGIEITGTKNEEDLNNRLRSSLMIRRSKESVLPELPPKQYNLAVFPANSKEIKTILKKEQPFNPDEIYRNGVPVGSALPEIRHELGREMVPQTTTFISNMLDNGVQKILLFAYHRDVISMVSRQFLEKRIHHVMIRGGDSDFQRETAVDRFQHDPSVNVYLANMQAGGIGLTLTAATDVVLMEPSWVPTDNEQCIDRAHRIGQLNKVNVHYLVVEGSIGAKILGRSVEKQIDALKILN